MQLIKEYILNNKKKLIIILIIIIIMTIISLIINNNKDNKIYFSEDYIYTKESYEHAGGFKSELPYINIKNDDIKKINNDLINSYYKTIKLEEEYMQYDYYIENNVMSLIVQYYDLEYLDSYPSIEIYNFDINSGKVLNNSDMLNLFSISTLDVSNVIEENIRKYYEYELNKGYFDGDFDTYLDNTASLPYLDNCKYYLTKDGFYVYKEMILESNMYYDTDSGFNLFNFKIK